MSEEYRLLLKKIKDTYLKKGILYLLDDEIEIPVQQKAIIYLSLMKHKELFFFEIKKEVTDRDILLIEKIMHEKQDRLALLNY